METRLHFDIGTQPDDTTCGPTCLHAVYRYFEDPLPLGRLIAEVPEIEGGGTLAVLLACHALARGYAATIYSCNLQVFDPTWAHLPPERMADKLERQARIKRFRPHLQEVTEAYLDFLRRGGRLRFEVLNPPLIRRLLRRSVPVLCGLSATYLYDAPREYFVGRRAVADDVRGEPQGHFVVLAGYDAAARTVSVADPYRPNPLGRGPHYQVKIDRLLCAILLGILTHDGDLLVIAPRRRGRSPAARVTPA